MFKPCEVIFRREGRAKHRESLKRDIVHTESVEFAAIIGPDDGERLHVQWNGKLCLRNNAALDLNVGRLSCDTGCQGGGIDGKREVEGRLEAFEHDVHS